MGLAFAVALGLLGLAAVGTALVVLRDRQLARRAREAVVGAGTEGLPSWLGQIVDRLRRQLDKRGPGDGGLAQCLADLTRAELWPGPRALFAIDAALVLAALAPMLLAMSSSLARTLALGAATEGLAGANLHVQVLSGAATVLSEVRPGFVSSGELLALALGLFAARAVALSRPSREARFFEALATGALARRRIGGAGAVLDAMTERPPLPPVLGAAGAMLGATALAVLALQAATELRRVNETPRTFFALWPEGIHVSTGAEGDLELPPGPGGRPLERGLSLVIDPAGAKVASEELVRLEDGKLPAGWKDKVADVGAAVESFRGVAPGPPVVLVLADRRLEAGVVVALLTHLFKRYGLADFRLVVGRRAEAAARAKQAQLPLRLGAPPRLAAELRAGKATLELVGGEEPEEWELDEPGWPVGVRGFARQATEVLKGKPGDLGLRADPELPMGQLLEILTQADTVCEDTRVDCGLPGAGLGFWWLGPVGDNKAIPGHP